MEIPVCIHPWQHFSLGWNSFCPCCNAYPLSFGNIKDNPIGEDLKKGIFNHENYMFLREKLAVGELADSCKNCSTKYSTGALHHMNALLTDIIVQIENTEQRYRATQNFNQSIISIIKKEIVVDHNPVYITVTCGSACNLRCKFCYNRNMDYHPAPADILRIIDKIHETLIFCQLTGGEPFVTKTGRALLEKFAEGKYKFAVRLGTNAQSVNFNILKCVNLAEVQISTDAATKRVYETIRVGGNFDVLISNIKKFVELKKDKPYMKVSTNFTITSDNYMDIPEACKLYESLGTYTMFNLVMREKDDPQNIKERVDLYEPLLKKIEEAMAIAINSITKDKLMVIKDTIEEKMRDNKNSSKIIKKISSFLP